MALFKKRIGGVIGSLRLAKWCQSLAPQEQKLLRGRYTSCIRADGLGVRPESAGRGHIGYGRSTAHFLWSVAAKALHKGWFDLGERPLLEPSRATGTPIDRHFARNHLLNLCARLRERVTRNEAFTLCIKHRQEDIQTFPGNVDLSRAAVWSEPIPRIPAMELLPDLHVETSQYEEAVGVCQQAFDFGVWDRSRGGFDYRIAQIRAISRYNQEMPESIDVIR